MGLAQVFDLKPYAMRSMKDLITERGDERMEELERDLKGEKDKIEMFKRELPLTVQILSDVMDGFREEMGRRKAEKLREFMPAEKGLEEVSGAETQKDNKLLDNKIHWMSSVQLWVDPSPSTSQQREDRERKRPVEAMFPPFLKKEKLQQQEEQRVDKLSIGLPEFALVPPVPTGHVAAYNRVEMESPVGGVSQRKSRRCWSPELHRQFVVALNKLGGAQVATPKQIRDLMKVDGLTNDEVKSHLQKYRLHNRRAPSANRTQPMGLMGALLGTSSENGASSNPSISHSVSPKDPHQFSNGTISTTEEEDGRSESYNWK